MEGCGRRDKECRWGKAGGSALASSGDSYLGFEAEICFGDKISFRDFDPSLNFWNHDDIS